MGPTQVTKTSFLRYYSLTHEANVPWQAVGRQDLTRYLYKVAAFFAFYFFAKKGPQCRENTFVRFGAAATESASEEKVKKRISQPIPRARTKRKRELNN